MTEKLKTGCRWAVLLGAGVCAARLHMPFMYKVRDGLFWVIAGVCVLLLAAAIRRWKAQPAFSRQPLEAKLFMIAAVLALFSCIGRQAEFYNTRRAVLAAPRDQLVRLGRHIILGYTDISEIKTIAAAGAVGGIYITRRNIAGKSVAAIRHDIDALQDLRRRRGLPRLLVAADQEGGMVSRLSPPLKRRPPLSSLARACPDPDTLGRRVAAYASAQAEELAAAGVNVNFGPVADLNLNAGTRPLDRHTQISLRAVSSDPSAVARVTTAYCNTLLNFGVIPTLKHFPGLGRVTEDTHLRTGELNIDPAILDQTDWRPFKAMANQDRMLMMLGHVRVSRIDPVYPASLSEKIIQGVLRRTWKYDGLLITDDLNMQPVSSGKWRIGAAAVRALNAGADLLLVARDPDQFYPVMAALLAADRRNGLDRDRLSESRARIEKLTGFLSGF